MSAVVLEEALHDPLKDVGGGDELGEPGVKGVRLLGSAGDDRATFLPLALGGGRAVGRDGLALTGLGELLLPSLVSPLRPISENTLNVALRRMGYSNEEMTSHGFRATFSTLANESGLWNPDAIERALAHVEGNSVRRAYARGEHWDERVRMADWWAGYLDNLRAS